MTSDGSAQSTSEATTAQRQRSAALVALMVVLAAGGAIARAPMGGHAPEPCVDGRISDGVLRCHASSTTSSSTLGGRAWLLGGKLDVNEATQRELESIAGIGPATAAAIVELRTRRGRFASIDELDDVDGIGPKTLEKLRVVVDVQ